MANAEIALIERMLAGGIKDGFRLTADEARLVVARLILPQATDNPRRRTETIEERLIRAIDDAGPLGVPRKALKLKFHRIDADAMSKALAALSHKGLVTIEKSPNVETGRRRTIYRSTR